MDKKDITYVCFVQNNLGILDGEEVVSAIDNPLLTDTAIKCISLWRICE